MVLFNYATKEITAKIVYYGPGLCGKTTNLQFVYDSLPSNNKSKMLSLATKTDRTLFFDFLPLELGKIRGMRTKLQLYTVPGQVYYNASRKLILKGVDGVVFVADSQIERMDANIEAMQNLYENMTQHGYDLTKIPFAIQYNKRDLPNAAPVAELQASLNPGWPVDDPAKQRPVADPNRDSEFLVSQLDGQWIERAPYFEAVALTGEGVFDTLKAISKNVVKTLG